MPTLNKFENGQWQAISSTDASQITSNSSVLREYLGLEGNEIPDAEKVMEALIKDSKVLKGNVSWLALHGGGGTGGGGGGGNVQADGIIYVNGDVETNSAITRKDSEPLSFIVKAGPSGISYEWNYTVLFGDTILKSGKVTTNGTIVIASANQILPYINGQGKLSITCTSGLKSIYWNGTIIQNQLNIEATTSSASIDVNSLDTSFININYSSTVLGDYIISINNLHEYRVTISDRTMKYTQQVKVSDIYGPDNIGSNTTDISIRSTETGEENSTTVQVVIVSDTIVISSNTLSKDISRPTSVIYGSTIPIQFTAYLSGGSFFNYTITVDGQLLTSQENARFGSLIQQFVPSASYEYVKGKIYTIVIQVSTANQAAVTANYYVTFAESSTLEVKTPSIPYLLSDFKAYNDTSYDKTGQWQSSCEGYIYQSGASTVTQAIQVNQDNILSGVKQPGTTPPYFRLSNKAYGVLSNYLINGTTVTLKDLVNSKGDLSISLCFKSDYHTDDGRTVLVLGDYSISGDDYVLSQGIEITVHEVKIKSDKASLSLPLEDSEITNLDITYNNSTNTTKVYINGVMTGSANDIDLRTVIGTSLINPNIYLGCSKYDSTLFNYADVQYYRLMIYSKALNDYEILLNFLQNQAYTNFTEQGLPDGNLISDGFRRNFISYNSTTGEIDQSFLWDNSNETYSVSNFVTTSTGDDGSTSTGINPNISLYTIPLPILYIDLSSFETWTWSNFTSNDASTISNLKNNPAYGAVFNYYDPNGSNSNIIKGGCAISLQGTSTLNDIIKNLNFRLNWDAGSATKTVFIPKNNWCPEDLYTLKADIVDSSHSSNASIGKFINEVLANTEDTDAAWYQPHAGALSKFKSENSFYFRSSTSNYKPTMKVAVEGFPVFVIIRFYSGSQQVIDVHSLGIYQFILGRDSEHNLGMKSLEYIRDNTGSDIQVSTVPYYKEGCTVKEFDMESQWVEAGTTISMLVNEQYPNGVDLANDDLSKAPLTAALWQYDTDTINKLYEVKYGTASNAADVPGFVDMVRNVAQAPVRVQSYFSTDANGVVGKEYYSGYDGYKTTDGINWTPTGVKITQVNSTDALNGLETSLDISSAYKYATVALMFGLVDNFCKNMPFISFDGDTQFKIGFYDMDTAFGMTNQGDLGVKSYVYMKGLRNNESNLVEEYYTGASDAIAISGKDNKLFLSLEANKVMAVDQGLSDSSGNRYSDYWIDLRNKLYQKYKGSYDTLADYFVEKFFKPQTEGCGELLFNLTYQAKYIDTKTYTKLHGRRISQVRQWLKEHIKFLDSITQWKTSGQTLALGDVESTKTLAVTSFDYYTTINAKTNTPVLITTTNQGGSYKYAAFCPKNEPTPVIYGGGTTTSSVSKTIGYSDNLLVLGSKEKTFGGSGFQKINNGTLLGFNDLDLSGCTTFSQDNTSPIDFISTFYNNGSELRSIDLSNTSGAKNLSLQLENFTKLTDINIYNGCVSSITLPKTPLVSLNVVNSALTEYTLSEQALLEEADVLGCSQLQSITIANCERMAAINNISNLPNLKTVSIAGCPKVTTLSITDCPNLTSIEINLEQLKTLVINNCPKLTNLIISKCGSTLSSLNLEGCTSLGSINFDNATYIALTYFNIKNTLVSNVKWGTTLYQDYLDLYNMPSLTTIIIQTNSAVKAIQFTNGDGAIPLSYPFTGCSNLERVYGNVQVRCGSCFYKLPKFSIHGPNTSTLRWQGKSVLSGSRVMMPYEVLGLDSPTSIGSSNLKQSGRTVTNMSFTTGSSVLRETNYTLFDVYYALSNLGSTTDCSAMFYNGLNSTYGRFNDSNGNSPNRYMFAKCTNVTNLSSLFWGNGSNTIRVYSPTVEGGVVTADDGLFSPLTKATNISHIFGQYYTVVDRFVFRRSDSTQYKISNMARFYISLIVEDASTTSIPSNALEAYLNMQNYGNLSNFFVNLQNLADTSNGSISGIAGLGYGTLFMDYTKTINFKIPSGIKSCRSVLDVQHANGEIILQDLFDSPSNVQYIYNCFRVRNSVEGLVCTFNINDSILSKFTSLRALGYLYDSISGLSGGPTSGALTGAGLTKIINQSTFPYNVFKPCGNTLLHASGLFSNASIQSDNIYGAETLYLPGTLFSNTPNIQLVSGTFYNFKVPYQLSSGGFTNCTKLTTCEYLFAGCNENISGPIPNKLFYHGGSTVTVTRTGTNTQPVKNDETGEWTVQDKQTISFSYFQPNTKIVTLEGCFANSYGLTAYEHSNVTEEEIERNPEYYPFKYIQNSAGDWVTNDAYNEYEYTYRWVYDGVNRPTTSKNVDNLDDGYAIGSDKIVGDGKATYSAANTQIDSRPGTTSDTMNFCCAPDLLRYCSNVSSLEIQNLFKDSGSLAYNSNVDVKIIYGRGLKGRIPPYLLKPVSAVTNISYMFYGCRALTCYNILEDYKSYLIPRDFFKYATKVNNLEGAFAGMRFPSTIDLAVFNSIGTANTLNLKKIFVSSHFEDGAVVQGVFNSYNASGTAYAFAVIETTSKEGVIHDASQSVTFSNVFKNYSSGSYATNSNYSYTFAWYNKNSVTHETTKTLVNNTTTYNYIYSDGTIPS